MAGPTTVHPTTVRPSTVDAPTRAAAGSAASRAVDGTPLEYLLELAVRAAGAGGAELSRRFGRARLVGLKSTATDPVTEADLASEAVVTALLTAERPRDGLLGEEGADRPGTSGLRWVVDPLDGTTNYLYGLPDFAVSIACEQWSGSHDGPGRWSTLVGVVHDPLRGETFTALRGRGARLDGEPIRVREAVDPSAALVATGFGYGSPARARQGNRAGRLAPLVRDLRSNGSAALTLGWVAAGRYDAYYEDELARWDWAAGALLAREAGALVTPLGTGVLAAGPTLHPRLHLLVTDPTPPPAHTGPPDRDHPDERPLDGRAHPADRSLLGDHARSDGLGLLDDQEAGTLR